MKNLSLFVTLGLISLMGAFTPVNAEPLESNGSLEESTETIQMKDESGIPSDTEIGNDQYPEPVSEEVQLNENGYAIVSPSTETADDSSVNQPE